VYDPTGSAIGPTEGRAFGSVQPWLPEGRTRGLKGIDRYPIPTWLDPMVRLGVVPQGRAALGVDSIGSTHPMELGQGVVGRPLSSAGGASR
jgi:hypothetical protein